MLKFNSIALPSPDFLSFVFKKKENLFFILLSILSFPIIWVIFKYYFPYPNIIFDSYHYLNAAISGDNINTWPIGYSLFVRAIGQISHDANFFITTQYVILNLSLLLFFFSIRYIFLLKLWPSIILYLYIVLNPIFIFTSNLILSDIIFTALSILWITNLIWIISFPKYCLIITHAIILLLSFAVRYNAIYYPLVGSITFLITNQKWPFKSLGIIIQCLFVSLFIIITINENYNTYGVKQFSPFGGWKLANDALYVYKHIYNKKNDTVPNKFYQLDNVVKDYFDNNVDSIDLLTPDLTSGSYYMYIHPSPLLTYRDLIYGNDNSALNPTSFAKMGPLYQSYGTWLIRKNPIPFLEYFIIPNIQRYFVAPTEVYTDDYSPFTLRMDSLGFATRKWFKLTSISVNPKAIIRRSEVFRNYSTITTIIHIIFILSYISVFFLSGLRTTLSILSLLIISIIGILWITDFSFNVLAAAIVLRYQIFISTIEFSFSVIFCNIIWNHCSTPEH